MTESKDDSTDIAHRLEQLNQWQEHQKKMLFARQNKQRKILGQEHKKMCELLGICHVESDLDISKKIHRNDTSLGLRKLDDSVDEGKEKQQQYAQSKKAFLRRKQGLKKRFRMDPDQFRLDKLPPYSFASKHPSLKGKANQKQKPEPVKGTNSPMRTVCKSILKLKQEEKPKNSSNAVDLLEESFQKSLISSKTACNSTPDAKSLSSNEQDTQDSSQIVLSWATILDPKNIKPIENFLSTDTPDPDVSIFELLEQRAMEGSIDLNSNSMKVFLQKTPEDSKGESFKVSFPKKRPVRFDANGDAKSNSSDSTNSKGNSSKGLSPKKLHPVPSDVYQDKKYLVADSTDTENEEDEIVGKSPARVHFADTKSSDERPQNISEALESSDASALFDEFKKLMFADQSDATILTDGGNEVTNGILHKADLIKARLRELEMEIYRFKENNLELIKSKQEHELEKAHFEEERKDLLGKLNDQKIKMEIYLHDERMKILEERKKMENQVRSQKALTAARDKKEVAKLQEEILSLQKDLKKKEELHIVSQSRLKAQIRNLEKDVRQLNSDMDLLNRENKRLEAEGLKINRQKNNKMLEEINRNIAKLTAKESSIICMNKLLAENISSITNEQSKPKPLIKRKSVKIKQKPSPTKSQKSQSFDDVSTSSSSELDYLSPKSTVTNENTQCKPTDEVPPCKTPRFPEELTYKREIVNPDGSKDVWYPNGNLKKISPDGMLIRMLYFNKDIKETNINEGTVKYYYSDSNTWHTTYLDGLEILEFPNGQTEHRYKSGKIEVHFPNNSVKITDPTDSLKLAEWRFADGTNLMHMKNGDKILLLPNGQKEIHTALSKRREYPDGTVKLVYPDGSQETRYSNGRVRLKDKDGKLIMDTQNL